MDHAQDTAYINAEAMSADITGEKIDCKNIVSLYVQAKWTGGSPVGNIIYQTSVDGVVWDSYATTAAGGGAGQDKQEFKDLAFRYFRVFYDFTSDTGALTVKWSAKCLI